MRILFILLLLTCLVVGSYAQPRVVVLPFDPVMDSLYIPYGGKESILNYRTALQEMITSDLLKHAELRVLEPATVSNYVNTEKLKPERWNDPALASRVATALGADYAIVGTYGEFSREIRVDARVALAAATEIPQGYSVRASAKLWEDLPTAAARIADQLVPILTAGGNLHPVSTAILYPEGDLTAYNPTGAATSEARVVVWVNAPAPQISAGSATFTRCDRIDLTGVSADKQRTHACRMAVLPSGETEIRISHRGYLPYAQTLTLAPGKAYRLEVQLKPVEQITR